MTKEEELNKIFRQRFGDQRPSIYEAYALAEEIIIKKLEAILSKRMEFGMPYSQTIGIQEAVELIKGENK